MTTAPKPAEPATAADIRAAIRRTYPDNEYALGWEVAATTGHNARRHLDCVCMSLWPSRGLTLHGLEIKVSRADWRRELKEPAKAEELARYLDLFSIVAPAGVVPVDELPTAWGLIELKGDKLVTRKQPMQTPAAPLDRAFMAAMMRAAARPIDKDSLATLLNRARLEAQEAAAENTRRAVESARREVGYEVREWREVKQKLQAIHPDLTFFNNADIVRAIAVVLRSGVSHTYDGLVRLSQQLACMNAEIQTAITAFVPPAQGAAPGAATGQGEAA